MQEQNKTIMASLMAGIPQEKKRKVIEKEKTSAGPQGTFYHAFTGVSLATSKLLITWDTTCRNRLATTVGS